MEATSLPPQTPSLTSSTELPPLIEGEIVYGTGTPPVEGAQPARTCTDKNGKIHILLCRTYAGDGWVYTAVAPGWVTITREGE